MSASSDRLTPTASGGELLGLAAASHQKDSLGKQSGGRDKKKRKFPLDPKLAESKVADTTVTTARPRSKEAGPAADGTGGAGIDGEHLVDYLA